MRRSIQRGTAATVLLVVVAVICAAPLAFGDKKKKKDAAPTAPAAPTGPLAPDFRKVVVFPAPPAIARVSYMDYFSAEKQEIPKAGKKEKPKTSWMDRMAGVSPDSKNNPDAPKKRFQLLAPYGLAVDSKGRLFVADTKVGAIFIFNTENDDVELIKHGVHAKFGSIFGLAMDDNDSLFVSDGELHHVLVFNAKHELQAGFGDDVMKDPNGMAIDAENRFLYVADTELDQILVYDADTYKLLRRIGTTGKAHTLTDIGNFSKPTNVAVDKEGNLYVSDTWNDRIEVFDGEGNFIRTWGKNGDGPGDFARPKGIAIDTDGHVWVADAMLNRVQVFTPEGRLLLEMGAFGMLPGQFEALTGLTIDNKNNRVFTSEQMLGRAQMYRYTTNAEAKTEAARRQSELDKKAEARNATAKPADAPASASPTGTTQTGTAQTNAATTTAPTPAAQTPDPRHAMKLPDAPVPPPPDKTQPPPNH
jgi:DNA-binding beta-propeller fold protein YncE